MAETLRITPSAEGGGQGALLTRTLETAAAHPSLGDSAKQTGTASRQRKAHGNVPEVGML